VFCWLLWPWISFTVTSYNARYIHQYVNLFTTPITIHTSLVLDCPHSQRTLRTSVRKLHTLMRNCLLPQHPHNSRGDLRRHAYCAARSPVNHWPAPATRLRRRSSNWPSATISFFPSGNGPPWPFGPRALRGLQGGSYAPGGSFCSVSTIRIVITDIIRNPVIVGRRLKITQTDFAHYARFMRMHSFYCDICPLE